eukprot:1150739-Pelagomonas_calceolata.AAC.5
MAYQGSDFIARASSSKSGCRFRMDASCFATCKSGASKGNKGSMNPHLEDAGLAATLLRLASPFMPIIMSAH